MKQKMMEEIGELKESLRFDFNKTFPPFIIYLATIIILLSFSKDLARVGFKLYWLLIRVGYLPFILIAWRIAKRKFQDFMYEIPLWAAAFYITCFCTYFSFSTGGLQSDYIFGLLQLYFAVALMPITAPTFYTTTSFSLGIYFGSNIYKFGFENLPDKMAISTLVPLIVFSVVVYIINSRIRKSKYQLQNQLCHTLHEREKVIRKQATDLATIETKDALGILAAQVAHDIRSPLAALDILTNQDLPIPEKSRILLHNVINRIRDIANDLIEKNRDPRNMINSVEDYSIQLLTAIIYPLITEKRLQVRSNSRISIQFELNSDSYGLFARVNLIEFKRALSNLINNSIEAISDMGIVLIKIYQENSNIQLVISDNGKGIPSDVLSTLGKRGISHDKEKGSGLGLYHARMTLGKIGGNLQLLSEVNKGSKVILTLPCAQVPQWFLPKLKIYSKMTLIILDDDVSIHQMWQERLKGFARHIRIFNFTSPEKFQSWMDCSTEGKFPTLYMFDLKFIGYYQTGVKLIEDYQLQKRSILITSHFEDKDVQELCEKLGIKMIPKDLAVFIPITFSPNMMNHES